MSGVYSRREVSLFERIDPLQGAAQNNRRMLLAMRPGKDDQVILVKSMEDADKGFATASMTHQQLLEYLGGEEFCVIRGYVNRGSSTMQQQEASLTFALTRTF